MTKEQAYKTMFKEYPDVLNIEGLSSILEISVKTAYSLLKKGEIEHLKVGREYRIPKVHLIDYLLNNGAV